MKHPIPSRETQILQALIHDPAAGQKAIDDLDFLLDRLQEQRAQYGEDALMTIAAAQWNVRQAFKAVLALLRGVGGATIAEIYETLKTTRVALAQSQSRTAELEALLKDAEAGRADILFNGKPVRYWIELESRVQQQEIT